MLDILIDDCINNIKSHLSYMDILCYKITSKSNYDKIKLPNFKDVFIKRLLEHNIVPSLVDAELLCDNLYNTGAYVAGSFILDCLFNTNYHKDIDIYDQTGFDLIPKVEDYFDVDHECCQEEKDRKYQITVGDYFGKYNGSDDNVNCKNLLFTQSLYRSGFRRVNSSSAPDTILRNFLYKSNELIKVRIFENKVYYSLEGESDHCIQIIPINMELRSNERSVIPRFIKASFDLDICQNIFDGNKLQIKNVNKLIYKYDYIKPNTRFMLSVYEPDEKYDNKCTEKRMEKYLERGFDIKFHPKYDEINKIVFDTLKLKKYNFAGHQNCKFDQHMEGVRFTRLQNNIKYIDNGEINLGVFDIN
jgi:hypothetical protein